LIDNGVVDQTKIKVNQCELINNNMPKQTKLNPKQKHFVEEYLKTYNAAEACRLVGFSESMANKLMQNPLVSNEINKGIDISLKKAKVDNRSVLGQLAQIAMEQDPVTKGMRWSDKLRALELLGKHLGMFREQETDQGKIPQVTINFEGEKEKLAKPSFEVVDYESEKVKRRDN
jgi:phage terminase small subunit